MALESKARARVGKTVYGSFFQRQSGHEVIAALSIKDGICSVVSSESAVSLIESPITGVRLSPRIGSVRRRVFFSDGSEFHSDDNNGLDHVFAKRSFVSKLEQFHPRLVVITMLAVALVFGMYQYGLPLAARVAVAITPHEVARLIGETSFSSIDGHLLEPSELDDEKREEIQAAFNELVAASSLEARGLSTRLYFRKSPIIGANAFALPDGGIVMLDELVEMLDPQEIKAVLAHELGHVRHQHGLERIYHAGSISLFITFIAGDIGPLLDDVVAQGSTLLVFAHSRSSELEADRYSAELLDALGEDPATLSGFFKKIKEDCPSCGSSSWISSHPGFEERIEQLEEFSTANKNNKTH